MPDEVISREESRFVRDDLPIPLDRISWGAVWAGTMAAIGMEILFLLFGLFIGIALYNPAATAGGMGTSAWGKIWYLVTTGWSLFFGAWVTSKLGVRGSSRSGALHGVATWGLTSVAALVIGILAVATILTGAVGTLQVASAAAPPAATTQAGQQALAATQQGAVSSFLGSWLRSMALFLWLGSIISFVTSILGGVIGARYVPPAGAQVTPRDRERLAA